MNIPNTLTVNETQYTLVRLLGKGKGGYSYLVTDGAQQYVLKQIHHEPCNYYAFGDKLQAELRDYETLRHLGIPLPELLAGLNIDYYPTNFVPYGGVLYYIDYECNPYAPQWDFEHWGMQYWTLSKP